MLQAVQALRVRAGGSGAAPVWRLLSSAAAKPKKTTTPKISAAPAPPHKTITIHSLATKKRKGVPISMVTAYDYPSAVHVDKAGIDILLVGDSVGMVELGHDTTLPVTLDDMIHHCKAVGRGCRRPLLVGDMPFGSYETSPQKAAESAIRIMKEAGMDAVKLEGGRSRLGAIRAVLDCGIAVMGHIGLMPQSFSGLGGFKAQGRTAVKAVEIIKDARALEEAGCFAMVLECVPAVVAREVAKAVSVPVIGIGSGQYTDGQVLVYHDMLGMMQHYHHAEFSPQFCKQYATVGYAIQEGLAEYKRDVEARAFPSDEFSPYKMTPKEEELFLGMVKDSSDGTAKDASESVDDGPDIKLY